MKITSCFIGIVGLITSVIGSWAFAITPLASKGVQTIPSANADTTPPARAKPMTTTNINTWLDILPNKSDKNYDEYIIIPGIGIIVPVIYTPSTDPRYNDIMQGRSLDVNDFLKQGVHHFPGTSLPGQEGNALIGGHSNFYKNQATDFTTIFAQLPMLDVNDQVWYYKRVNDISWIRYVYQVSQSYETSADDARVFDPIGMGSQITLYTCVPIGTSDMRWIIRTSLLFSQKIYFPITTEDYSNFRISQSLDDQAQNKLRVIIGDVQDTITNTASIASGPTNPGPTQDGMMLTGDVLTGEEENRLLDMTLSGRAVDVIGGIKDQDSIDLKTGSVKKTNINTTSTEQNPKLSRRQNLWNWIKNLWV